MAQAAVGLHRKVGDAVMQAVGDIQLLTIVTQRQTGGKAGALILFRQRGDGFAFAQQAALLIQMIESQRRRFFVDQPQAVALWRKDEVAWAGARRRSGDERRIVRRQLAAGAIQPVLIDPIQPQIGGINKFPAGIGGDHMGVRAIVIADGEAALDGRRRAFGACRAFILMLVHCLAQATIFFHR